MNSIHYKGKARRRTNWDYRSSGYYFITINTKYKNHHFGFIENGIMYPSKVGVIAQDFWNQIPESSPHVSSIAFTLMPDHLHGIIALNARDIILPENRPFSESDYKNKFAAITPKAGSVSAIIRSYKSAVTKEAKQSNLPFQWQPRFHDSIIKDQRGLDAVKNYILNNPKNWSKKKLTKT
jgi:putative transposase